MQFSPWEISGHASLTAAFFRELGAVLNNHSANEPAAKSAYKRLAQYSKAASFGGTALQIIGKSMPYIGLPFGPVVESIAEIAASSADLAAKGEDFQKGNSSELSLSEVKRLLTADMAKIKRPILVVIDDIDRLTSDEIREVFQLVKANADFPKIIYLMMFDRGIVAKALNSVSDGRGHEYLEKIIQVLFHVPQPPLRQIHKIFFDSLEAHLLDSAVRQRWETQRWNCLWPGGLSIYFSNLRSVYRFLSSFSFHVSQMRNEQTFELNPLDLITLETLRLFEPSLYEYLPLRREILTGMWLDAHFDNDSSKLRLESELNNMLSMVDEIRKPAVKQLLAELFPRLFGHKYPDQQKMQRQLRIGHNDYFERYFAMSLSSDDVSQSELDSMKESIANTVLFTELCKSLKVRGLVTTAFERLDAYKQDFPISKLPALISTLIDVGDIFPAKVERDLISHDALDYARQLISCSLKKIDNEDVRHKHICDAIESSKGVRLLVEWFAREERSPEREVYEYIISEQQWSTIKAHVLKRIKEAADDGRLKNLVGLKFVLWKWKDWGSHGAVKDWILSQLNTDQDALWVLKTFLSTSQCIGENVTYTRYIRLDLLSQFVDIELIEKLTSHYELAKLPLEDMRALRAFRQALQWKQEGKPYEYTGERWNFENPLEEDS